MNMHDHLIDAIPISNTRQHVLIPRIKLAPSNVNLPFVLERRQFPIRLAYSMTIDKAQGQTFNRVGIAYIFHHQYLVMDNSMLHFQEQNHSKTSMLQLMKQ